ncbi:ArsR family transcriptional regulator [Phenylobacterium sp.]|uniref:VpaChn25_0724 family phage protein n=1 Tax=Phenylobacterium sp. TaxID=1871053 RepID=UPI0027321551|nr:ArsR family transcriptional regulator [Phenylobacterium sp.]MDP1617329.1 ArsR family transcriptional regulator [Phenylobacterium sp.]MDP1985701.1 ArsR family transcriptional regulator [Phenylobacterium sp.]
MSYATVFQQHLRLAILRVLDEMPGCKANSSILHSAMETLGFSATRDTVRNELAWLAEQNLVVCSDTSMTSLVIATLTERGGDVAAGRAVAPGVQRPTPRG